MEQVEVAVRALHEPSDSTIRAQALRWLEKFQNSVDAWTVALKVLSSNSLTQQVELSFFAAQTLKHKIIADFAQLDGTMVTTLRSTLWKLLMDGSSPSSSSSSSSSSMLPKTLQNQLILALAALAVQSPAELWPTPIEELLGVAPRHPEIVLAVLACVPEQLSNPLIHMSSLVQENQQRRLLDLYVDKVISFVGNQLPGAPVGDIREALLTCLLAWIKYGAAGPDVVGSPELLGLLLQALLQDIAQIEERGTLVTTAELLCELYFRLFQLCDAPSSEYLGILVNGLEEIRPKLSTLDTSDDQGEPPILTVGRVFLEAGEAFLPWIMTNQRAMHVILEAAMLLVEHPQGDSKLAEATFSFWAALEGRLSGASEMVRDPFIPVFGRLFRSLIVRHLAFPLEDDKFTTAEERDNFRDFRHVIGDCLKDCTRIMGSTETLSLIGNLLQATPPGGPWQHCEAILFALRTISSSVERRESETMPMIATLLFQLAATTVHPKLVYAVILNVGCYAEWIRYHSEFLSPFLSLLAANVGDHSAAVCMSLKYLCESCAGLLLSHEVTLRSLYTQAVGRLGARDTLDLSEAVSNVLAAAPEPNLAILLPHYVGLWTARFDDLPGAALENLAIFIELIGGANGNHNSTVGGDPVESRGHLVKSPTMESLLLQMIPALPALVAVHGRDESVTNGLISLLQAIVVNHPQHSFVLVDLIDELFARYYIPGALMVLRQVVMNSPAILPWSRCQQSLLSALNTAESQVISGRAELMQLMTASLDYYEEILVDPLLVRTLNLAKVMLTTNPPIPSDIIPALLLLAHLVHRMGNNNNVGRPLPTIMATAIGPCVQSCLEGLATVYPLSIVPDVAVVLKRLYHYDPAQPLAYFNTLVEALPDSLFVNREKQTWIEKFSIAIEAARPRELKEMLSAFFSACRRRL